MCKEKFSHTRTHGKHWLPKTDEEFADCAYACAYCREELWADSRLWGVLEWHSLEICATVCAYCLCWVYSTLLYLWHVKKQQMMCFRLCKFYILVRIIHAFSEHSSLFFNNSAGPLLTSTLLLLRIMRVFCDQSLRYFTCTFFCSLGCSMHTDSKPILVLTLGR